MLIAVEFYNNSGGALTGTVSWNAIYVLIGIVALPPNGDRTTIVFMYDGTVGAWVQQGAAAQPAILRPRPASSAVTLTGPVLSSPLSTGGGAVTSLSVNALPAAVASGSVIASSGNNAHTFTTTGAALGATSIPISSATPNFNYPTTSSIGCVYTYVIPSGAATLEVTPLGGGGGGGGTAGSSPAQIGAAGGAGGAGQVGGALMSVARPPPLLSPSALVGPEEPRAP